MDITGANAVLSLTQAILFPNPQQLIGFAADDVYDFDEVEPIEVLMGVDGTMSAGFTWKVQPQKIMLQADSPSCSVFDIINTQQVAGETIYALNGVLLLPAIGLKMIQTNGVLTRYKLPGAKKLIGPRSFTITWNLVSPAPA